MKILRNICKNWVYLLSTWDVVNHGCYIIYPSNLPCLYSTFHLEYPLVLSRFCISHVMVEHICNIASKFQVWKCDMSRVVTKCLNDSDRCTLLNFAQNIFLKLHGISPLFHFITIVNYKTCCVHKFIWKYL